MKIFKRGIAAAGLAGLVVGLVVACGGGGGGSFAGIDRLGVTNGTITGFGSIIVNGVHYQVNSQTGFDIDDSGNGGQDDLQPGQVVTINWATNDNGVTFRAADVTYNKSVEGPVASIDTLGQSFVVLGQTVIVDTGTSFDSGIVPQDITGLLVGDNVEVSGFIDATGAIRGTRVERKAATGNLEVRGVVNGATATTFNINDQVVNYAAATLSGFSGPIADGDFVEAKGNTLSGGQLLATTVKLEDEGLPGGGDGDEGELEGFVTAFASPASFSVNGVPVVTQAGTVITDGVVALNVKVEVKGQFNAAGELVADTIEVKTGSSGDAVDSRLTADVESINVAAGQLIALGVTVSLDASTRIEDQRDDQRPFGLANLSVGDYVEVRGIEQPDGSIRATLLERRAASNEGELRGLVSALNDPEFTLLDQTIATDGSTEFNVADFFGTAVIGTEVQVKFQLDALGGPGAPIPAQSVEIDD